MSQDSCLFAMKEAGRLEKKSTLSLGVSTRFATNRAIRSQKETRDHKLRIYELYLEPFHLFRYSKSIACIIDICDNQKALTYANKFVHLARF